MLSSLHNRAPTCVGSPWCYLFKISCGSCEQWLTISSFIFFQLSCRLQFSRSLASLSLLGKSVVSCIHQWPFYLSVNSSPRNFHAVIISSFILRYPLQFLIRQSSFANRFCMCRSSVACQSFVILLMSLDSSIRILVWFRFNKPTLFNIRVYVKQCGFFAHNFYNIYHLGMF